MKYVAGVDVGSTQTKAVIIDQNKTIVGRALLDMETSMVTIAQDTFNAALANADITEDQVLYVVGTGYGRYNVTFGQEQVTEISCHARGAIALFPGTRTVIDIGGQDTKAIRVKARWPGRRLHHERQMCRRHRALSRGGFLRARDAALGPGAPRAQIAESGAHHHDLHGVRRVRDHQSPGQGHAAGGRADGRAPGDHQPLRFARAPCRASTRR